MIGKILSYIYNTRRVTIVENGKIKSVYWRYIILSMMTYFKFILLENMYKWFCENIDVKSEKIQIVRNIDYVDRYIIYDNTSSINAIQNGCKYVEENLEKASTSKLPQNIVRCCMLESADGTDIDLKKVIAKYTNTSFNNVTIKDIINFNDLHPKKDAKILVTIFVNKKLITSNYELRYVENNNFMDIYA